MSESPRTPRIDTRAPFQSVKDAVSLFGPTVSTPLAKKPKSDARVLEKESQHHMLIRELECYKDHLRCAETAKSQALKELERANFTLQQLTCKLDGLNRSKQASAAAAESAKLRAKELEERQSQIVQDGDDAWKADIDGEREGYKACTVELIAHRQELASFKRNFDMLLHDKRAAVKKLENTRHALHVNREKQCHLSKEIAALRENIENIKAMSIQAQQDHSSVIAEKDSLIMSHKEAKKEVDKEIKHLKSKYIPKGTLQEKIESTMGTIKVLKDQLSDIQASDLLSIKTMASDIENAKMKLQQVVEEEESIRIHIQSIKMHLEEVSKERSEAEDSALKVESIVQQMQIDLDKMTTELESAVGGCISGMQLSLEKLSAEAQNAAQEAEDRNKKAELLKQEACEARIQTKEAEQKLKIAVKEAKAAKAAEKLAEDKIHTSSPSSGSKGSGFNRKIRLSIEEFDSLMKKIEESGKEADAKVATANEEVKNINAREKEIPEKLETILKEKEALQLKISSALKRADMAEAAKRIVESELQKWRQYGKPTPKC